jgi:uncharacterized membrane protein YkvA (DUF1232 family)
LSNFLRGHMLGDMAEIAKFVERGTASITPRILRGVHKMLPLLKLEFTNINDPSFPHLGSQLQFLADVVEDFAEGEADDLPYVIAAAATFALVYAHRQTDLIPDSVPEFGHADDSGVVRAVLIAHERALADYADQHSKSWHAISVRP